MSLNEKAAGDRGTVGQRGRTACCEGAGERPWAWRQEQAAAGSEARRTRRALPQGGRADRPARARSKDHRSARVDRRSRREADPKGKLGKPTEFGYVAQICEVTEYTRGGARGFNPARGPRARVIRPRTGSWNRQLPSSTVRGSGSREVVADGGFQTVSDDRGLPRPPAANRSSSPGATNPAPDAPGNGELATGTGIEGRISHLKRGYGLRRSRLKGHDGMRTWTGWAILAYDLDTLAIRTR